MNVRNASSTRDNARAAADFSGAIEGEKEKRKELDEIASS